MPRSSDPVAVVSVVVKSASNSKRKADRVSKPGYGPKTRPNPHAGKVCSRGFKDCGATPGTYDPKTRQQKGRKHHSVACRNAWKESGAVSLVGADAHRKRRDKSYTGRASGEKAARGAARARAREEARLAREARTKAIVDKLTEDVFQDKPRKRKKATKDI
mmetsp:Transcript_39473/g.57987  ORF Transcript_39473/g.57987 Transcript_39473/m.57987 type:complete len:161 (-) Transcript_39473:158-640(-)|eukprot:CAMPEP_0195523104 /NCGR_PEP_ID=MMETSP0794_2-20130614/21934_1 /TAXON_ID=515487 /ORGANISM="Stephanopyxis turris, Strain CCMP 815" /LENGTH=160 /DNA_ID=CAMNT_0040653021 /DNA_START=51 /DNA_END=533 /DNA_ORIENTATION=+